jgi:hypothetical protein
MNDAATSKATKITAANSAFLRAAKIAFNVPTYKRIAALVNGPEGEQGARAYAATFINVSVEEVAALCAKPAKQGT